MGPKMIDIFEQLFTIWVSEVGEEITRLRIKAYLSKLNDDKDKRISAAVIEAARRLNLLDEQKK